MKTLSIIICLLLVVQVSYAQHSSNSLNQYGIASLFMNGSFRSGTQVSKAKQMGNFGIAAPSMVDGELIELDGTLYQTKANGETRMAPDSLKVPFGMFCFFKADTVFHLAGG